MQRALAPSERYGACHPGDPAPLRLAAFTVWEFAGSADRRQVESVCGKSNDTKGQAMRRYFRSRFTLLRTVFW